MVNYRICDQNHKYDFAIVESAATSIDKFWTPVEMGIRYKQNSPVPTELWTVNNAKHALMMKSEHKAEYEKKVLSYFNQMTNN